MNRPVFHNARRLLVGPPDPISNIRPVRIPPLVEGILQHPDTPHASPANKQQIRLTRLAREYAGPDLEYRLQQRQLEQLCANFWTESNTLFEKSRKEFFANADPCLEPSEVEAQFLAHWLNSRNSAYAEHSSLWWKGIWGSLWPSFLANIRRWRWKWACRQAGL